MVKQFVQIVGNTGSDLKILEADKGRKYGKVSLAYKEGEVTHWSTVFIQASESALEEYVSEFTKGSYVKVWGFSKDVTGLKGKDGNPLQRTVEVSITPTCIKLLEKRETAPDAEFLKAMADEKSLQAQGE